jgi:hypothetical protein
MLITHTHRNVLTLLFEDVSKGWEKWFLLSADRHHDNAKSDHALARKHLMQCRERGGHALDFGDLFCAMQGKWDKRADQSQLRDELRGNNYLDALVDYNGDFFEEFADLFLIMSPGNHETSILKHHQTNLNERLDGLGPLPVPNRNASELQNALVSSRLRRRRARYKGRNPNRTASRLRAGRGPCRYRAYA